MCGRYCLTTSGAALQNSLEPWIAHGAESTWLSHYGPRVMIRPGEPVLVLRREHMRSEMTHMLWGLLPSWVKDPSVGPRPINARAETLNEKSYFRGAWRHHRCLLPSNGFWEKKQRIHRSNDEPFWLAGLWERWIGPDGSELESCCVITTRPNALIRPLHDRMPVIIPNGLEEIWLEEGDGRHLRALEPMLEPWETNGWTQTPRQDLAPEPIAAQLKLF